MAEMSLIQWCMHTWSPWHGCTKISPGCQFCYAALGALRNPGVRGIWGPNGTRPIRKDWQTPLKWDRRAREAGERWRIFPSICDPFEGPETMPAADWPKVREARVRFYHLLWDTQHLDWLVLTKRPENILRFWDDSEPSWYPKSPRNLWLGASVEDQQRADERIPQLLDTPAAIRWLSVEPLLGPIDLTPWLESVFVADFDPDDRGHLIPSIDWVVVGGESGPHARPCNLAWIRSIVEQCKAAGVPCFVKQLGAVPVTDSIYADRQTAIVLSDPKGGDPAEWPEDLRVREFPAAIPV